MYSLNAISGYNILQSLYEKNKDKKWFEWLDFKKVFPNQGKQGVTGLFISKDELKAPFVFKLSQVINYIPYHELIIANGLNDLADYCPHFSRSIGSLICEVDPLTRKQKNPFDSQSKYKIEKEVILTEYIDHSCKFYNYIYSEKINEEILFSVVKQTLLGIAIGQREKNFTHYDLHSNNIMIKKCSKDLVFLYILDSTNQFCISTRGYYPIIIDFGFSYSKDIENLPFCTSLNHTEAGFIPTHFDQIRDPELFLVTVADEINESRKSKKSKKLKNISLNNYSKLNIDWNSGWDIDTDISVSDYLIKKISKISKISKIFHEYTYYCLDIVLNLNILPLKERKSDNLELSLKTFLKEFSKIEDMINDPFYCLYILKGITDSANIVSEDYRNKEKRQIAIGYFRHSVLERIDSISKYSNLSNLNWEKLLCSLICFVRNSEGILAEKLNKRVCRKRKNYEKVYIKSPEELCFAIDVNIPDKYKFNEQTTVLVIDNIKKNCYPLSLSTEEKDFINSFKSVYKGMELFKILKKRNISK